MDLKFRRIGAYLIDYAFIVLFSGLVAQITVLNPYYDEYLDAYDEYYEVSSNLDVDNTLDMIDNDEYITVYQNVIKYNVYNCGITIVIYLLYFVGFQKWNKNQTLGKKMFRIKLSSADGDTVSWGQYLLRTIIIYNLLLSVLMEVFAYTLNGSMFIYGIMGLNLLSYVITMGSLIMILVRKDNLGIHDIVAKTKIIEA